MNSDFRANRRTYCGNSWQQTHTSSCTSPKGMKTINRMSVVLTAFMSIPTAVDWLMLRFIAFNLHSEVRQRDDVISVIRPQPEVVQLLCMSGQNYCTQAAHVCHDCHIDARKVRRQIRSQKSLGWYGAEQSTLDATCGHVHTIWKAQIYLSRTPIPWVYENRMLVRSYGCISC